MNGALSVLGATLAIFIAMNWGFQVTLLAASATYLIGLAAFLAATRPRPEQVASGVADRSRYRSSVELIGSDQPQTLQ